MKKGLFTVGVLIILSVISYYMANTLKIDEINVYGNEYYTDSEVLSMAGIRRDDSIFTAWFTYDKNQYNKDYIKSIRIKNASISSIDVYVVEKGIIGYLEHMGKYICIDSDGLVTDYIEEPDRKAPTIKGVRVKAFAYNEPLQVRDKIIPSIYTIFQHMVSFGLEVDSIDFNYENGEHIVLKIDEIRINIGNISDIHEKFDIINQFMQSIPEGEKGILNLEDPNKHIIFEKKQ